MMQLRLVLLPWLRLRLIICFMLLHRITSYGILALLIIPRVSSCPLTPLSVSPIRFVTVSLVRYVTMNDKLKLLIFCLKNLPRFARLCAQLLEEWYKLETCQNDEVGVL